MASLFAIERIILTDMILLSNFETMARRKSEGIYLFHTINTCGVRDIDVKG